MCFSDINLVNFDTSKNQRLLKHVRSGAKFAVRTCNVHVHKFLRYNKKNFFLFFLK